MTPRIMWVAAALALLGPISLAGCQGEPGPDTATLAPSTALAPTTEPATTTDTAPDDDVATTTSPPELSDEEQDQADIEETLLLYTRALDDAFNGDASVEGVYPFARDTAREQWVTEVMASEAQGITSSGLTKSELMEVSVNGDTAEALVCADVSDVKAVNANGESIIAEDRVDQTLQDFVLERDDSAELAGTS